SIEELRVFFGEDHQHELLKLDADGVTEESGSDGRRFLVKYKGEEKPRKVVLARKLEGDSATNIEAVKKRLTQLPDVSIEQNFPGNETFTDNKSTHFTVRTSEKEQEIVQTVLERLLRDKSGVILEKTYVKADPLGNREAKLYFYDKEGKVSY